MDEYPSWPKGTDCKSVSFAFSGSNPLSSTMLGYSQVGKAQDFDSCIPQVRVLLPQPFDPLAQSAEHLTFNQGVPSSNLGWVTIYAGMAKLADALDLGSSAARRGGSSPLSRTNAKYAVQNKSHCCVKTVAFSYI